MIIDVEQHNRKTLPRLPDGSLRFPRGWFMIGPASDFPPGQVRPLHYFDRDLAVWRGSDGGQLAVFDAHCPHLGAHLGVGSEISDNSLICPAHGARFAPDGSCLRAPRHESEQLCPQLQVHTWPVREVNGVVLVWYDPEGNPPAFEIDPLPEYQHAEWSDWHFHKMELNVHPREIIENVSDKAHFVYVHGFDGVADFRNDFHRHLATQYMRGSSPRGSTLSISTYFGPGYQITWMSTDMFESRLLNAHAPVDANHTDLWFGVMLKKKEVNRDQVRLYNDKEEQDQELLRNISLEELLEMYAATVHTGFEQDVGVWRRKLYRMEPLLCDGDGPLNQCRKWYSQFYRDAATAQQLEQPLEKRLNPHIHYP